MNTAFNCDQCGQRYEVDQSLGGKKIKCKKCGAVLTIPSPSAAAGGPVEFEAEPTDLYDLDEGDPVPKPTPKSAAGPARAGNPYGPPEAPVGRGPRPQGQARRGGGGGDDAVSVIIPYKNSSALIAYYLGLFSCCPVLGLPMAVAALVLGVKGLKAVRINPDAHGTAHAWVGLVCGTIGLLINLVIVAGVVVALIGAAGGGGRQ